VQPTFGGDPLGDLGLGGLGLAGSFLGGAGAALGAPLQNAKRRRRVFGGRPHKVTVRLTEEEFTRLSAQAAAARLSLPAVLVVGALAPRGGAVADPEAERALLVELFAIRRSFSKLAANINGIAKWAHGSGEVRRVRPPRWIRCRR